MNDIRQTFLFRGLALSSCLALSFAFSCSDDSDDGGGAAGTSSNAGTAMTGGGSGGSSAMAGSGGSSAMAGSGGSMMTAAPGPGDDALNGIALPQNVEDWGILAVHSRTDNGTIRMVVGNEAAVTAARAGTAYPDGTMIADLVWAGGTNPDWEDATTDPPRTMVAPAAFNALLLMVKDSTLYADSGGWGYANWAGSNLTPSADANFDQACIDCHTDNAMGNDYVFTRPGALPTQAQIDAADDALNGLSFPSGMLGWKMIGLTSRSNTVRAVIGNDAAVTAARAGTAYPDGAMLADFVWGGGANPDFANVLAPVSFNAVILMEKDATAYADDGGWRYANWSYDSGAGTLTPSDVQDFDQACIDCHTAEAMGNDYVFTRPAALPE